MRANYPILTQTLGRWEELCLSCACCLFVEGTDVACVCVCLCVGMGVYVSVCVGGVEQLSSKGNDWKKSGTCCSRPILHLKNG